MAPFFSSTETTLDNWNVLTKSNDLEDVREASKKRPQLLYKHSHTCSICVMAKESIENRMDEIRKKADLNFVNVIEARPVSNAIEETFEVRHESPQILLITDGASVWNTSHFSIKAEAILKALKEEA